MKTAFVTGTPGFTGSKLALRLLCDGWQVKALVLPGADAGALKNAGVDIITGDITKKESYQDALAGVDVIFHLAAVYREQASEEVFRAVHIEGTRTLFEAACAQKVGRVIHCSTVGVHGEIKQPPADEQAPFCPDDLYQETKLEGELVARAYIELGRIPGAIYRPVGIYGPGDMRFRKLFKMVQAPITLMVGKGTTLYQLTYIDDLIDGILLLASRDEALGQTFILSGDSYTTITELMHIIARVLNKKMRMVHIPASLMYGAAAVNEAVSAFTKIKPVLYKRRLDFFTKDRAFTSEKAQRMLSYQPKVSLEEGIRKTAAWYKSEGLL